MDSLFSIALISTGGTIEKTYDESEGVLANGVFVLDTMLCTLQLDGVDIHRVELFNKDSLNLTEEDHCASANEVLLQSKVHEGVIIIHGTDTLSITGDTIINLCSDLTVPCVLTGAI